MHSITSNLKTTSWPCHAGNWTISLGLAHEWCKNSGGWKEGTILSQKENPKSSIRLSVTSIMCCSISVGRRLFRKSKRCCPGTPISKGSKGADYLALTLNQPLNLHSGCLIEKKVLEVLVRNNLSNQNVTIWNRPTFCGLIGHSLATTSFFQH